MNNKKTKSDFVVIFVMSVQSIEELRKFTHEYDEIQVEIKNLSAQVRERRKRLKVLEPFVLSVLNHIQGKEPMTKQKNGTSVSQPLLLPSQNVAQITERTKKVTLSYKSLQDAIETWFKTKFTHITDQNSGEFITFLKQFLTNGGSRIIMLKYRPAKQKELPDDVPAQQNIQDQAVPMMDEVFEDFTSPIIL